jgi:hypothetical protein
MSSKPINCKGVLLQLLLFYFSGCCYKCYLPGKKHIFTTDFSSPDIYKHDLGTPIRCQHQNLDKVFPFVVDGKPFLK